MHEGCKGHGVQTNRKNGAVGARQKRTWRAPTQELARQPSAPTLELARTKCQVGAPTFTWLPKSWLRPKKPTYSIVYRGDVSVRKRSARHNACGACCFITRSTCRAQTRHASRAEHTEHAARRSRGRLRSRLPARAKRVAHGARHYCTHAHFWGAASSQFGYPAYAVVPRGSHWSHG